MKIIGLTLAAALLIPGAAWAQPQVKGRYLDGVWSNASVTQLNRPANQPLVISPEQAKAMAAGSGQVRRAEADARPTDMAAVQRTGGDVGGYNASWLDPGMTVASVKGEFRTSWIVEPANGQMPLNDKGRAQARVGPARQRNAPAGPENMAPNDRCLIGSRGSGGPGMLNNLYNNTYQIVVSKDAVAIDVEMVHDVRVIPLFKDKEAAQAGHGPAALHPWLGDSTGWWEGGVLVVETINVHPEQGSYGPILLTAQGRVVERFQRWSKDQIYYSFEVTDPAYYTQPWKAEMSLTAIPGQLYEYACHEGNYALEGMLAGAREEERQAAAK